MVPGLFVVDLEVSPQRQPKEQTSINSRTSLSSRLYAGLRVSLPGVLEIHNKKANNSAYQPKEREPMNQLVAHNQDAQTVAQLVRKKIERRDRLVKFLEEMNLMKTKSREFTLRDDYGHRLEISKENALKLVDGAIEKSQAELTAIDIQLNAIGHLMGTNSNV